MRRFACGLALLAGLLSLLGSLLAPAALRIQPYPGLFPGPAAPGLGLPFVEPRWPLLGALLAALILGLWLRRPPGALPALAYSSACLVWGMLWGGGLTERGLIAAGLIGLLAAACASPLALQASHLVRLGLLPLPHALCLLFVLGQNGLTSPFGLMLSLGLTHLILALRGALTRPLLLLLFVLQSALLVLGTALFPLLVR